MITSIYSKICRYLVKTKFYFSSVRFPGSVFTIQLLSDVTAALFIQSIIFFV